MARLHKSKQYLLAFAKVLVLSVTFGYIYHRLQSYATQDFIEFLKTIFSRGSLAFNVLLLTLIFAILNWTFEILKWKTLISTLQNISFSTALKQTLASLTVSLATPNRIGDYGAKVLFFEKQHRKKVLLFNFYSNATQLLATLIFGLIGLFYFIQNFQVSYSKMAVLSFGILVITAISLGYIFREKELWVKGFTLTNTFQFFHRLSTKVKIKVIVFSVIRYLIFSGMFYFLLLFFGAEIGFSSAMLLIFAMYLLVSIVPSIFIFDVVIRGGVALWLFSFVRIPEFTVLATVLTMWIFNFVIPSIIGSVYVLRFQPAIV